MDKLEQLTQKLYEEGLSKGKAEGQAIVEKARSEAADMLKQAEDEAQKIIAQAEKEAADLRTKVEGDVKRAATQAIQATRSDIEQLIIAQAVDAPVKAALSSEAFLKEIITEALILPEKLQKELEPFIQNELGKIIGKGIQARFSKKIAGGMNIGPKDGSYFISLTDETFQALIGEYLRPATKKILFG